MPDQWSNLGILYTRDAKQGIGGVITAQRDGTTTIHSRIVFDLVSREETEKLFAVTFAKRTRKITLDLNKSR
jgi:hypothetical protein